MTYKDIIDSPELSGIKDTMGSIGLDFKASSEKALDSYYSFQPVQSPNKEDIIKYVIDFLEKIIDEKLSKPAKTDMGKVVRVIWKIGKFFGLVSKAKAAALKL